MLMESFVAIMAMVAASVIEPGVYFAMNSPAAVVGTDVASVAQTVSSWGFLITPEQLEAVARDIGEHTILARLKRCANPGGRYRADPAPGVAR